MQRLEFCALIEELLVIQLKYIKEDDGWLSYIQNKLCDAVGLK